MNKYRSRIEKLYQSNITELFSDNKSEPNLLIETQKLESPPKTEAPNLLNEITKPNISLKQDILADETDLSSPLSESKILL